MNTREEKLRAFGRLLDVMDELRRECPWDRKQTNESLRSHTIEEVYELCEALMGGDAQEIKKELGDVLLHIVFYCRIAEDGDAFDVGDVCQALCDKLIFRHPHVFGSDRAESAGEVMRNWEQMKLKEKDGNRTVLAGVPASLPSVVKACRIQEKARNAGFDWERREDVWSKVREEVAEVEAEIAALDPEGLEEEFGDLLFSLINAARLYKVHPDNALERTNQKFIRRFNHIERRAGEMNRSLQELSLEEMEALWQEAK
jgi:XTP/dITP diphosphohydrolase